MSIEPSSEHSANSPDERAEEKARDRAEDAKWVEEAQAGDGRAFDALVKKYSPKLYGLVYHMTSNREDSYDLLQDIFAKAYRSLPKFKGNSSFYTWIYAISVNMTLNFLKKRNRRRTSSLDEVDSGINNDPAFVDISHVSNPRRQINIHELQKKLNESMMRLSEHHRTVVTMFDIQGMSHAEVSKILKVSEGTVRSRLYYAHQQLRGLLEDFEGTQGNNEMS